MLKAILAVNLLFNVVKVSILTLECMQLTQFWS